MKYVSVIVDNNTNATDELYSYACEFDDIKVGSKIRVPFSVHNRELDAYVAELSDEAPKGVKRFKKVVSVDPDFSLITD